MVDKLEKIVSAPAIALDKTVDRSILIVGLTRQVIKQVLHLLEIS